MFHDQRQRSGRRSAPKSRHRRSEGSHASYGMAKDSGSVWIDGRSLVVQVRYQPRCVRHHAFLRPPSPSARSRLRRPLPTAPGSPALPKSNSASALRAGNRAARIRPSPPWDSRAATSRCRQAIRNSSWVQVSDRARSASRVAESRSAGAFSARVRKCQFRGHIRAAAVAAPLAVAAIVPPLHRCRGRCHNRHLHFRLSRGPHNLQPFPPQRTSRGQVRRVSDGLVLGPGALMVGRQLAPAGHPDPVQSAVTSSRRPIAAGCTE